MKKYFWVLAIVAFLGLSFNATASGRRGYRDHGNRHQSYHHPNRGYHHPPGHRGYYAHPPYHHHRYYGHYRPYRRPHRYYRRASVRVVVPAPPVPRVIIRH